MRVSGELFPSNLKCLSRPVLLMSYVNRKSAAIALNGLPVKCFPYSEHNNLGNRSLGQSATATDDLANKILHKLSATEMMKSVQ